MTDHWPSPGLPGLFGPHDRGALVLGRVESIQDDEGLARVEVSYPLNDDAATLKLTAMAPIAQPFAGSQYGAFLVPNTGDVVVLGFLSNDFRSPVVLGSVWHGTAKSKESHAGEAVTHWALVSRQGSRIAMIEDAAPKVEIKTPGGAVLTISDEGGGTITAKVGGSTLTATPSEITLKSGSIKIEAGEFTLTAGATSINTANANFSSAITSQVCTATTVVGATYTTGAGNVL